MNNNAFNAKMGVEVNGQDTAENILAAAGLDFGIDKVPTYATWNGRQVETGQSALIRSDNGWVFDNVPNGWNVHSNADTLETARQYADTTGAEVVRAGSLDGGQTTFFILSNPGRAFALRGDDLINNYTMIWNVHKYGTTLRLADLFMRQVCTNGMVVSDGEGTTMKINHRGQLDPNFVARTFANSTKATDTYRQSAEFLASRRYNEKTVREYLSTVFPTTAKPDEKKAEELVLSRPAQIVYDTLDTQPGAELSRGTWWTALNAVTHATNHLLGNSDETRTSSLMFGVNRRRNQVAFQRAIEYARAA